MKQSLVYWLNPKAWGTYKMNASSTIPVEHSLEVYRQTPDERSLVGRLSREQDEFVFRYDSEYGAEPISAFPRIDQEYRSRHLWPFFAARIPPFDRDDMPEEMLKRSLQEDQIIDILGGVAKFSVTNPYEFELAGS